MNYYLISDTHFNHSKLDDWGGRSGDWQERLWEGMDSILSTDTVVHLGDICIGNDQEIHDRLSGYAFKKILVRGNHDKKGVKWYEEHGWDFVCDSFELLYQGHYLYFSHRPQPPMSHFTKNIHGHTHGNLHRSEEYTEFYDNSYHIDISPEVRGFSPLRLDTLLKSFKSVPPKQ